MMLRAEGICVIDLDYGDAYGLALHDFGDMVRTATSPTQEDERDLSKVTMQFPMFEALWCARVSQLSEWFSARADLKQHLVSSGKVITFGQGCGFWRIIWRATLTTRCIMTDRIWIVVELSSN